jgi:hypothetical protein
VTPAATAAPSGHSTVRTRPTHPAVRAVYEAMRDAAGAAEQPDEGQHARCVQCGGPIVPTIDPYNDQAVIVARLMPFGVDGLIVAGL